MVFQCGKKKQLVLPYYKTTRLSILTSYKDATKSAELFALCACSTDQNNNNLVYLQKHLLKWHYHKGNLGFQNIQWISRKNDYENVLLSLAEIISYLQSVYRTPNKGATMCKYKNRGGVLTAQKLQYGDIIFVD